MLAQVHDAALLVVMSGALLRGVGVILLSIRTFLERDRFASVRIDRGFVLTAPEPFLMTFLAVALGAKGTPPLPETVAAAMAGAVLVLGGWLVVLWTLASWPSIFVGHALLRDHRLVTTGAYGLVRHPVYLGAFLIWLGLGVGFANWWVVALTVAYIVPAYLVYMRDEEAMLEQAFGEAYRDYRSKVPMLVPRLARRRALEAPA